ncbi:MAG TPA: hypothetical protein ENH91_09495 [Leeuwenhoekiella sp.]|nr:hypothetical protein [Leeuwenhoekiella sp.]
MRQKPPRKIENPANDSSQIQEYSASQLEKIDQLVREAKSGSIEWEAERLCEALKIGIPKYIVLRAVNLKKSCEVLCKEYKGESK